MMAAMRLGAIVLRGTGRVLAPSRACGSDVITTLRTTVGLAMPVRGLVGRVPIGVLGLAATTGATGVADRVPVGVRGLTATPRARGVADVGRVNRG